jgi:hypothetical protein
MVSNPVAQDANTLSRLIDFAASRLDALTLGYVWELSCEIWNPKSAVVPRGEQ